MIEKDEVQRRYNLWSQGYWEIPDNLDTTGFDFNWKPEPHDRPYIHQFGTQHQKTGGPKFVIPEHEGIKYESHQHAIRLPNPDDRCWRPLVFNSTMDFSWHPDDTEPPFIYVFGNQWYDVDTIPTYQYRVKGATNKKYMYDVTARLVPIEGDRRYRPLKSNISFDYSWQPHPHEPPFIYVFGNQWYDAETMPTLEYRVPGATQKKYITDIKATLTPNKDNWIIPNDIADDFDYSWVPNPHDPTGLNYQFGTQWQKTGGPLYVTTNSHTTKYCDILTATKLPNESNRCWRPLVSNAIIDCSWHPDDTEPPYIYVFGNQWYDSSTMPTYQYRVNGAVNKKYITNVVATLLPNKENWEIPNYVTDFDYSWLPSPHEPAYIQQFSTAWGDVEAGPRYVSKQTEVIKRNPLLIAKSNSEHIADKLIYEDSIFDALIEHKFEKPFVHITRKNSKVDPYEIVCSADNLIHTIDGVEAIISSKVPLTRFYDKVTDYQNIKFHTLNSPIELLDIVFFSNGEACADDNYEHLLSLNLPNRIVRIDSVNGRVASQHAAANASNTSWYFLVNAKLKVNKEFDFNWQPNRMKSRRHYIFTAINPVNGLEYGHQAIVANNKKLTLNTVVRGLDFTMDSPTEIVKMNSGVSTYNTSAWDTWRTAFRECIKLRHAKDKDSGKRLSIWVSVAEGEFGEYSIRGASDAVKYYNSVNGELDKLMLSYDWAWLRNKFDQNNLPLINTMIK